MYLSRLTLNPTHRHVQADLASDYELHKTVLRAFPSADDGGPGRVLFRVDESEDDYGNPQPIVLVQSEKPPDWTRLIGVRELASYARRIEHKAINPAVRSGQQFAFRLRANPTVKREGRRHGLCRDEDQQAWLSRKAETGGFRLIACRTVREPDARSTLDRNGDKRPTATFTAVRFDGVLEVVDTAAFRRALTAGIGSAKGFGFGLLSVGPAPR